ncbi:coth-domain-containing protein [Neocallimastix lanati (nom. inval.)]|nr:coth-domain-containing protein [Neocallimastix sp. JGI-2020a]
MDNEVPIFRITLPGNEFYNIINSINHQNLTKLFPEYNFSELLPELPLKDDGYPNIDETKFLLSYQEYLNLFRKYGDIKEMIFNIFKNNEYLNLIKIVDSINEVNFNEMFPGYNFTEILPELPMNENGHPNIDYKKYIFSDDEYRNLEDECNSDTEIFFHIFNNNEYLNLIKVFYIVSNLNSSTTLYDERIWEYIQNYKNHVIKDEENFIYINEYYIQMIKNVLPMKENGHPNIDYKEYIISDEEYGNLEYECNNNEMWDTINSYLKYVHSDDNENFSYRNTDYIFNIKEIVNSLNEQNFYEIFPGYNFTEILPELPMNENGHPNIDYNKYIISDDKYQNLVDECISNTEILINIFNNNEYLNLIKVFHTLYNLNVSTKNDNDELCYILTIKGIVDSINKDIILQKYYQNDEYRNLEDEFKNNEEILFNIFNNNEYLNLIKVFYTLSELETPLRKYDEIWKYIYKFGSQVFIDSNGNFIYLNDERFIEIKEIIEYVNKQNFTEIFPGINFSEILPELPMNENGHPSIDLEKCIKSKSNIQINENEYMYISFEKYIFDFFNNNEYLNLIKIFYTLSHLYESSFSFGEINDFIEHINDYIENVYLNENGDLVYKMDDIESDFYNSKINDYTDNYNTSDLMKHIDNYKFTKTNNEKEIKGINEFKTKNATMIVEINNQKKSFNKITFSLGGQFSRTFSKPPFNLKIRGGKELFGRRQFKLRGDATDPSSMRTKLMSDIHNKLGLPSLSANYAMLYINDEFMGLYILTDAYKESWIEYVYGEKDTTNLYKCEYSKSAADVESIFDIEQFIKKFGHNYYIYKNPKNNKWTYLIHDFDLTLGNGYEDYESFVSEDLINFTENKILNALISSNMDHKTPNEDGQYPGRINNNDNTFYTMEEWEASTEFDNSVYGLKSFILLRYRDICHEFNIECDPNYLGEDINVTESFYSTEIESSSIFISTSTFDSTVIEMTTSIEDITTSTFDTNIIETNTSTEDIVLPTTTSIIDSIIETSASIEDTVLPTSTLTFDSEIIETSTSIEDNVLPTITSTFDSNTIETTFSIEDIVLPTSTSITDSSIIEPTTSIIDSSIIEITTSIEDTALPTSTSLFEPTETETLLPISETIDKNKCLSEFIGYLCCSPEFTTIYAQDEYGDWSYDFVKNEWCGLTVYEDSSLQKDSGECWSEELGYPCCKGCRVYETDSDGSWGYEFNQWCGIISAKC